MTVFRWICGVLLAVLAAGSALSFIIYIIADIKLWLKRARNWRRLTSAVFMFYINVEIWRRVALVIIHW
jgi:O-succinylbenzoate synthase